MEICLLQMGLLLGLAPFAISWVERATMASLSVLVTPQEPGKIIGVSMLMDTGDRVLVEEQM